ncbi:B12-binding domain-containing radical SAM protein [Nitratidesulfovibrio vulgaris]|jgi:magnesium-protoporphyrin IX monomethyl ester (oxidative) cyclase|uniref:Magnesium-protoporphyrin IX monomethyl ester (Oxidative) cyclase n=1 Tax=Nitratidesulfovibrio vulgaris (strain DP4) TaxID=391774 RepID=A0A0H3A504_NITV4|nr:radical SAM protein [Nitratidesulfovibrio vulgaris]ABM27376.1 Magnesium-protoporphyrin IX monomethyl ester (oxidative) cyclase [Nitratidesulfovibrio vulgaris DP4]GEB80282.1 B12-binding domain-containing radical SAM protein [Desulfovibrio desulfuricans]
MKVLCINPPDDLAALLGDGASFVSTMEPLGLLYVAAACREAGHEVAFIDAYAENLDEETLMRRIRDAAPQVVSFTSFTSNGGFLYTFGRRLRQEMPGVHVLLGNVHATIYARQYLASGCCDVVVRGEGEEVMPALLRVLEEGGDLSTVPSIAYVRDGVVAETGGHAFVRDLSTLPLPARDLTRKELYSFARTPNFSLYRTPEGKTEKHLFSSRGCVNRCTFCVAHKNIGIRVRPIDSVIGEVDLLLREYDAGYIFFCDSLFTSRKKRIIELSDALRHHFPGLRWGCEAHVNTIDEDSVRAMAAGGCVDMNFGIESGVDRLLTAVNKRQTTAQIADAIRMVKRVSRINAIGLFILGLPGERPEDSDATIDFACSLPLDMAQFSILTPYPGSPIFEQLRAEGIIDDGVRPGDTLDPEVWRRYSSYASFSDNKPIWVTPEHSVEGLLAAQKRALRRFYLRPRPFLIQLRRLRPADLLDTARTFFKTFF